jgi:hypothetical protein
MNVLLAGKAFVIYAQHVVSILVLNDDLPVGA